MLTIENFLDEKIIENIISLMEYEIENHPCTTVPKYQSYTNMHIKYANNDYFKIFLNELENQKRINVSNNLLLKRCWFNICRKDSKFGFHTHEGINCTAVFFVKNCTGNGTIFKLNNSYLHLKVKDNSLVFFDPALMHSIPEWENYDRYSIAIDFIDQ